MKISGCAAFVAALLLAVPSAASAAPSMHDILRATYAVHDLTHVSISQDGRGAVWEESFHPGSDPSASAPRSAVFLQRIGDSSSTRIQAGSSASDQKEPSWSPDGSAIAFLSTEESGPAQVYTADAHGSSPRLIASLNGYVQSLKWSPDGRYIGVLYIPHPHRKAGALATGARNVGVIGATVDEQRLSVIDVRDGTLHVITPSDVYVYEYGWAPDSKRLTFTYAHGNGDNNWWIAHLGTIDLATRTMHDLYKPAEQINAPQWSPDGKRIAFIGGLMSDFGSVGGDVYVIDPTSRSVRDLAPGMRLSAASLRWIDSTALYMSAHERGNLHLYRIDLHGTIAQLTHGVEAIRSWDVAHQGSRVAFVRTSFVNPPEVYLGSLAEPAQLSHVNPQAQRLWGNAKPLEWTSDGHTVQGWLIYPLAYDPHRKYPMVTIIHGGPSSETLPGFGNRFLAALSSRGFFVFEPNPRGSFGQGEAFTRANVKDFGYGDWRDDLRGMDAAVAAAPIDSKRLGLFGWSYGGYMGMWAETQTKRLKAIVAGAGIVNWQSYYGQNNIDQWMIPFFGASVYDDPQVYAKSSPITFIKNSGTPVLVLQGERDEEVPAPQAFEFWHAMESRHVPTQLVVYADEGHGISKLPNQIDILTRMVGWFQHYM